MEVYEGDRERAAWERQAALERAAWDPNTTAHQLADLMASGSFASGTSPSAGLSSRSSPGGGANGTAAGAGAGGVDSYVPVVLAYDLGTHGGYARAGLSILYHGHVLLRGAPIPAWAPHPSWRVGFAAASGVGANACRVRRVRLWAGAPAEAQPTPLHITSNGQDYEESAAPPLLYIGRPIVSVITPASGPTAGGSLLLLAGEGLRAGSSYYGRFGPGGGGMALDARANAQWAGPRVLPALNTSRRPPHLCTAPRRPACRPACSFHKSRSTAKTRLRPPSPFDSTTLPHCSPSRQPPGLHSAARLSTCEVPTSRAKGRCRCAALAARCGVAHSERSVRSRRVTRCKAHTASVPARCMGCHRTRYPPPL